MRKLLHTAFVLGMAALLATGCDTTYKEEYPEMRVDRTYLALPASEGTIAIMVYYSGSWQAALDADCTWATLDKTEGKGISVLHLTHEANLLEARQTNLTLSDAKDEPITINITQNAGI